jgi:adenylate cyclase
VQEKEKAMTMQEKLNRLLAQLFGDPRTFSLEHRLFNTISLLNGIANLGGSLQYLMRQPFLFYLHIVTGLLFLLCYWFARFRGSYRRLYYPFVILIMAFLYANTVDNAGSMGGAHYFFIPALVIAVTLAVQGHSTVIAFLLCIIPTIAMFVMEYLRPAMLTPHASTEERLLDVASNFVFAQFFTGIVVLVLARNLNQERKKSDRLLLNILPESIAEELKRTDKVVPLHYDCVSVVFTDFVGFTNIAEKMTAAELIAELDNCFRAFDSIARRHKLEKIKTIGDSYMAAGGIPTANKTNAIDCVLAAFEIAQFMADLKEEKKSWNKPFWQLRLGIHSGEVVAGVIGDEKFAYDVWGDTVNTASRMESSGVADMINISGATYDLVKDFFLCEYRGKVKAKNKGEIDMYFVHSILPHLTHDGRTPHEKFYELYNRLAEPEPEAIAKAHP